jgi:hypothetical protein
VGKHIESRIEKENINQRLDLVLGQRNVIINLNLEPGPEPEQESDHENNNYVY